MSASIVTSRLGGQEWRRTETPDAVGVRARRWALRLSLVLAAGAAGLAVSSGSAQADSGLGGTLDHVAGTVKQVTGSSGAHVSHSASKESSSSHASGSHRSTRSGAADATRPLVRTVQRATRPVVHATLHRTAPAPAKADRAKPAHARAIAKAPSRAKVTAPAIVVTTTWLDLRLRAASDVHPGLVLPIVRVELLGTGLAVDLPAATVDATVRGVWATGAEPPVVRPAAPELPRLDGAGTSVASTSAAPTSEPARTTPTPRATTATPLAPHGPAEAGTARTVVAALGRVSVTVLHDLPWTPLLSGTAGSDLGVAPGRSTAGAGATGALLVGLTVTAGLAALRTAHGRTPDGLAPRAFRLPRLPGFAPD